MFISWSHKLMLNLSLLNKNKKTDCCNNGVLYENNSPVYHGKFLLLWCKFVWEYQDHWSRCEASSSCKIYQFQTLLKSWSAMMRIFFVANKFCSSPQFIPNRFFVLFFDIKNNYFDLEKSSFFWQTNYFRVNENSI